MKFPLCERLRVTKPRRMTTIDSMVTRRCSALYYAIFLNLTIGVLKTK